MVGPHHQPCYFHHRFSWRSHGSCYLCRGRGQFRASLCSYVMVIPPSRPVSLMDTTKYSSTLLSFSSFITFILIFFHLSLVLFFPRSNPFHFLFISSLICFPFSPFSPFQFSYFFRSSFQSFSIPFFIFSLVRFLSPLSPFSFYFFLYFLVPILIHSFSFPHYSVPHFSPFSLFVCSYFLSFHTASLLPSFLFPY